MGRVTGQGGGAEVMEPWWWAGDGWWVRKWPSQSLPSAPEELPFNLGGPAHRRSRDSRPAPHIRVRPTGSPGTCGQRLRHGIAVGPDSALGLPARGVQAGRQYLIALYFT